MSTEAATNEPNVANKTSQPDHFWYWAAASIAMMAAFAAIALWAHRPGKEYGWYLADFSLLIPIIGCMFPAIPIAVGVTALSGIRSQKGTRWLISVFCLFGLVMSLAASYGPVAGKLIFEGVFSGWTVHQMYLDERVIRLGIQPAGDFSASWYDVYECVGGGIWCRDLGSIAGEAYNQGQLPAKVELQVGDDKVVRFVLDGRLVGRYQNGQLICEVSEAERCH